MWRGASPKLACGTAMVAPHSSAKQVHAAGRSTAIGLPLELLSVSAIDSLVGHGGKNTAINVLRV